VFQSAHVARHLEHVVEWGAGRLLHLEEQQVGERRLRALDLRGEHGLLAHVAVEEEVGVREQGGDGVQPAEGEQGTLEQRLSRSGKVERRLRRQRRGDEGAHGLTAD
jgi:hypothetical protein